METIDPINPIDLSESSHAVALHIAYRSAFFRGLEEKYETLKEQMKDEKEREDQMKTNVQVRFLGDRMAKLVLMTANIHDTFRTIPFVSERLKMARALFYKGKFPELDEFLDFDQICAHGQREDQPDERQAFSYELIIKALYHHTFNETTDWIEAVRKFLSAAVELSDNVHTSFEWGDFLTKVKESEPALEALDRAYKQAGKMKEEEYRLLYQAKCLASKGIAEGERGDYAKAAKYASQALALYTELAELDPVKYRSCMVDMLITVGDYHMSANNPSVAVVVYEEAIKIRRPLVLLDDYDTSLSLALLLDKQAAVHTALGEYKAAFELYEESLRIHDTDAFADRNEMLEMKANTIFHMVETYVAVKDYESALRCTKEAMDIYHKVDNIDISSPMLPSVKVMRRRSEIHELTGQWEEAVEEKEMVMMFITMLAPSFLENEEWMKDVAETTYSVAKLHLKCKNKKEYFTTLVRAFDFFGHLDAVFNKEEYKLRIACIIGDIAYYHETISRHRKPMRYAANKAFGLLSEMERDEEAERIYQDVQRIIRDYPERKKKQ
jgi:tetratricopeptide (TPR) repeat protein